MGHPDESLVLHSVRLQGMATASQVAARFRLDPQRTEELLLDAEALGWVRHVGFLDTTGWSLTDAGRAENERRLADEAAVHRELLDEVFDQFVPLNARLLTAITKWQMRPAPGDAMAMNDHTDWRWDDRVLDDLGHIVRRVVPLCERLAAALPRFAGYDRRLLAALNRVESGERSWVDRSRTDSIHTVWFELHEDLLATLGLSR